VEDETIGEVVVGIDTSGSIGTRELTVFATELASVCELCQPEQVRILWWDTQVHGEQIFKPDQYANIASVLKPIGGGGTVVSAVSEYIVKNRIYAVCVDVHRWLLGVRHRVESYFTYLVDDRR
jgi:predicted metal-dependent peptidase